MSGGGLSLLADLTQGGIVPLWAGERQQLFVLHAAIWAIFRTNADRKLFVDLLGQTCRAGRTQEISLDQGGAEAAAKGQ